MQSDFLYNNFKALLPATAIHPSVWFSTFFLNYITTKSNWLYMLCTCRFFKNSIQHTLGSVYDLTRAQSILSFQLIVTLLKNDFWQDCDINVPKKSFIFHIARKNYVCKYTLLPMDIHILLFTSHLLWKGEIVTVQQKYDNNTQSKKRVKNMWIDMMTAGNKKCVQWKAGSLWPSCGGSFEIEWDLNTVCIWIAICR